MHPLKDISIVTRENDITPLLFHYTVTIVWRPTFENYSLLLMKTYTQQLWQSNTTVFLIVEQLALEDIYIHADWSLFLLNHLYSCGLVTVFVEPFIFMRIGHCFCWTIYIHADLSLFLLNHLYSCGLVTVLGVIATIMIIKFDSNNMILICNLIPLTFNYCVIWKTNSKSETEICHNSLLIS